MVMVAFFAATALLPRWTRIYGTISLYVNVTTKGDRHSASRWELKAGHLSSQDGSCRCRDSVWPPLEPGWGLPVRSSSLTLMAGLFFGVSPTDVPTFAGVTLLLTAVALAASYIPALRAMRLDPITMTPRRITSRTA